MATYSKETALYDTGAISEDIKDAASQANKYITDIGDDGIKVHPYNDESNYNKIDPNGMEIWQTPEGEVLPVKVASFGADGAQIGQDDRDRFLVKSHGLTGYNQENVPFFEIDYESDSTTAMVHQYGGASVLYPNVTTAKTLIASDTSTITIIDGDPAYISLSFDIMVDDRSAINTAISPATTNCSVTELTSNFAAFSSIDTENTNLEMSADITLTDGRILHINGEAIRDDKSIEIRLYMYASDNTTYYIMSASIDSDVYQYVDTTAPSLSMGIRNGAKGPYSSILGEELYGNGEHQLIIGRYNKMYPINRANNYALIIGNGRSSSQRGNCLEITKSGEIYYGETSLELGTMTVSAVLTSSAATLTFTMPTGRTFHPDTYIQYVSFNVVGRVASSNVNKRYLIKSTSGGYSAVNFSSSFANTFYNASNEQKRLLLDSWHTSIEGNSNIRILLSSSTPWFFCSQADGNEINNQPVVLSLSNIEIWLVNPIAS